MVLMLAQTVVHRFRIVTVRIPMRRHLRRADLAQTELRT
jgi:hypothetical protein